MITELPLKMPLNSHNHNTNPNIIGKKKLANLVHAAHFLVNRIRYAPS